ncbi:hypothetical protein [Thermoflexus hugenholtzii]
MAETRSRWSEEARTHLRAASRELREAMKAMLPEGFWQHLRAARRETLLALRTAIDAWLEEGEKPQTGSHPS